MTQSPTYPKFTFSAFTFLQLIPIKLYLKQSMHWIVGDIHGMLLPLTALLNAVQRVDTDPTFYFAGDYINRGSESRRVVDLLLSLRNAHFVRGNHDDLFDQILNGSCYADNASNGNRLKAFSWFMGQGLANTLCSYGADLAELEFVARKSLLNRLDRVIDCVPSSHRNFFRNLLPIAEGPGFFVAHGKWDPADSDETEFISRYLAVNRGARNRLIWGRFTMEEITARKAWSKIGYFGHTPVDQYPSLLKGDEVRPIHNDKLILLDTAAALYPHGRLSAICHEEQLLIQADRSGKLIGD
jgi:serine/threonine protein phosphatase 1